MNGLICLRTHSIEGTVPAYSASAQNAFIHATAVVTLRRLLLFLPYTRTGIGYDFLDTRDVGLRKDDAVPEVIR